MMPNRINFTIDVIDALPVPAEGRSTAYDTKVPKLAVRVTAKGTRTFYVITRSGSAMEWVKLGVRPDMTPEQARKRAQSVLGEFADGKNPAAKKRAERNAVTLQDAFDDYIAKHVEPQGVKRADEIKSTWWRFLGTLPDEPPKPRGRKRTKHEAGVDWSARRLESIETTEIRSLHAEIGKTHRTYANRVVELLSAIYNRAIDWGYKGSNPAVGVRAFREAKRARFLNQNDPGELQRFFEALATDTSQDFRDFVHISLLTGARRSNVLAMRWQDINLETAVWTVPDEASKNDEAMVLPLVGEAIEILQKRSPQPAGYVFPADSRVGHMTPPKKRWRALLKRAEVADLRIHDLRRSLGSWQAISGASLAVIGKSLGHKSPAATAIYARLHLDPVRASLNTATSAMLTAAGVKKPADVVPLKGRRKRKGA